MPRSYRIRVAVVLALLLCLGTIRGTVALEAKTKSTGALTTISRISTKQDNGQFAATIETDGPVTYKSFSLHSPERVVVDITGARTAISEKGIEVNSNNVTRIRVGAQDSNSVRIVFDVKDHCAFKIQNLAHGLAINFSEAEKSNEVAKTRTEPKKVVAPPVAPPDTTGVVGGGAGTHSAKANSDEKKNKKEEATEVAKLETKETKEAKKDAGETRSSNNVPSVKGPSIRPGIPRAALARPSANTTPATDDNPADPQGPKLRFGDPGFIGDPISIDIAGVDINDILRFISDNYGENFILDRSVGAVNVTVKVNDVPWNQVLESIFKANQLSFLREGLIVRVATLSSIAEEQEKQRRIEEEKINNLPKLTKFIRLKYVKAGTPGQAGTGTTGNLGGTGAGAGGATGLLSIIRKSLSKVGEFDSDPRTNQLIITDIPQNVAAIEDIVTKLDVPEPQVEIEARIVIANRSFNRVIGNQLAAAVVSPTRGLVNLGFGPFASPLGSGASGGGGGGTTTGGNGGTGTNTGANNGNDPASNIGNLAGLSQTAGAGFNQAQGNQFVGLTTGVFGTTVIANALSLSEQKGITKTVSTPRVTVQNNTPADITSGTQIAVQTEVNNTVTTTFVTAALRLNVIPQIADEGNILLKIVVENNSVDRSLRTNGGTPSITTQRAETLVLVPDGGTTVLGGINLDTESSNQIRVPGISKVPFVGELFKRRSVDRGTQELLFFVTPRIYRPETFGAQSAPPTPTPAQPVAAGPENVTGGER